jgi:hypothetical protein
MSILARILQLNPNTPQGPITDEGINISSLIGTGAAEAAGEPLQGQAQIDQQTAAAEEAEAAEEAAAASTQTTTATNNLDDDDTDTEIETPFVSDQVTIYKDGKTSTAQRNVRPGETKSELQIMLEDGWSLTPNLGVEGGDDPEPFNAREFAQTNYSFLGNELLEVFISEYETNGGDVDESLRVMRETEAYKRKFPGIFREDGTTLRFTTATPELDYIKMKEDYFNALEDYNLNPNYFEDKVTDLFLNDVDPKTFETRLDTAYTSLFNQFDAVKAYYVENYPAQFPTTEDITDEAIFASFISEDVSSDIISQRVNVSQIGGAFKREGLTLSAQEAQRFLSAGLSGIGAQRTAQRAAASLPRLQRLAQRFTGREDIFGLSEFIESEVFGEGVSQQVRERLEAEQATVFTREGGAAATQAGITGLVEQ